MYKEYFLFIFVAFVALNFLPYTEKIVFGDNEDFSFQDLQQIERFGTEHMEKTEKKKGSDTSSTNKIIKLIENNRNKHHETLNKRMARLILSQKRNFFKFIEELINDSIKSIKKNKDLSTRIIKGTLMNSSEFDKFKKSLYTKLDAADMKSLYEPIKDYYSYINKDLLPNFFKKLIILNHQGKKKFTLTDSDKKLIEKMIKELYNTKFNFTLAEVNFMMIVMSDGEHTTLNAKEKIKMIEKNSKYLKSKNPMYNLSFFLPMLKVKTLDKLRFDSFIFYLTFLYRKFHKQLIMFRKLSLFSTDDDLKSTYKRFLTKTAKFVSLVSGESLKSFKRVS
jgi:hypothetical protein